VKADHPTSGGLLEGTRVLDLSIWRPGPYATQLLAEIGADVVKIEPPGGDPMRVYPELFTSLHANKRSEMLDLKTEAGHRRALALAAETDVVIEGFRPGVAARLGVGYNDIAGVNPSVIYCSVSGMGQDGELALAPGHDLNYQAWAGSLAPDGGPPVVPAVPIADLSGGMAAAMAICAALVRRLRTGEGEHIDVAMSDVLSTWTGAARPRAQGVDAGARGVPGYGTFATADGRYLALGVLTEDHFWRPLCDVLGVDGRDLTFTERMARGAALQAEIAAAIAARQRDELAAELAAADVPVAPVLDRGEMLTTRHFRQRQVVTEDPWSAVSSGYPVRLATHPARRTSPPPGLDEHAGVGFRPRSESPSSG
jgi:crotonobetainyl-CoA:carnitine CoA-transferase CaiB-like acyl-CoA transferase